MKEAVITSRVKKLLDAYKKVLGKDFFWYKTSDKFTSGIPDIYILYKGISVWIELKAKGKKPVEGGLQELTLKRLNSAGAEAFWTRDFEEVEEFMLKLTGVRIKK